MDPTSSNQAIRTTIEFRNYSGTPPSADRRAHTPSDIPSSPLATSPRRRDRVLETLRLKFKRDASPSSENIIERSPSRKRSIVDLFQVPSLRSRGNTECEVIPKARIHRTRSISPKKDHMVSGQMNMPEVYQPKRRKSLGDLMGSLSMRGRHSKRAQTSVDVLSTPLCLSGDDSSAAKPKLAADSGVTITINAVTEENDSTNAGDSDPQELQLDNSIQSRMDPIREDSRSPAPSEHSWSSGEVTLGSRRAIYSASEDGREGRRSHTPDSYLRLLIEAASPPCRDLTPSESCKDVSPSPLPYKFQAIQPVDFLEYQSTYEEIEVLSKPAGPSANTLDSLEPGIFLCPEDLTFESPRLSDKTPIVSVQEVDPAYELTDLDPSFQERMNDLNERYLQLHLDTMKKLDALSELCSREIGDEQNEEQRIKKTVAKMTQNHRFVSSFEDCWPEFPVPAESSKLARSNLTAGEKFEQSQAEVLDSIIHGSKVFQNCAPDDDPEAGSSSNSLRKTTLADKLFELPGDSKAPMKSTSSNSKRDSACSFDEQWIALPEFPLMDFPAILLDEHHHGDFDMLRDINNSPGFDHSPERLPGILRHKTAGSFDMASERVAYTHGEISVQFPDTVNLYSHIEKFDSISEAFSALFDYKLSDLSNFCTYDPISKVIFAHSLDDSVPNPADLKDAGLQLIWLPMLQVVPPTMPRAEFGEVDHALRSNVLLQATEEPTEASVAEEIFDVESMPSPSSSILGDGDYKGIDQDSYDDTGSEHDRESSFFDDSFSVDVNRAMTHLLESHVSNAGLSSETGGIQKSSDLWDKTVCFKNVTPSATAEIPAEAHTKAFELGLESRYRAMHSLDNSEASEDDHHYEIVDDNNMLLSKEEVGHLRKIGADFFMPDVSSQLEDNLEVDYSFNNGGISADDSSRLNSRAGSARLSQSIEAAAGKEPSSDNLGEAQCHSEITINVAISASGTESHCTRKRRCGSFESTRSIRPGFRIPAPKRTPRKEKRMRRHRGRSYSADSLASKNVCFEESANLKAPRISSHGFRQGFNFTAFADQLANSSDSGTDAEVQGFDGVIPKEKQKSKSTSNVPLALPSLTKLSVSLQERSLRNFEMPDGEKESISKGKGPSKAKIDLLEHQLRSKGEGSPLKNLAPSYLDDMNIRLVGKAARGKESPKVGALVEIFQARGLMPPSLKPGFRRTPSPISATKKAQDSQPSQEQMVPGDIWSAFVE